jgi:hypothetical protein
MSRPLRALLGVALVCIGAWSLAVCPPQTHRQSPHVEGVNPQRDNDRHIRMELIRLGSTPSEVDWFEPTPHGAIAHLSAMIALVVLATGAALFIDATFSGKPK